MYVYLFLFGFFVFLLYFAYIMIMMYFMFGKGGPEGRISGQGPGGPSRGPSAKPKDVGGGSPELSKGGLNGVLRPSLLVFILDSSFLF